MSDCIHLNDDVLEMIFQFLDFKSLCSAEMTCRKFRNIINDRRLYWQLSKRLSAMAVPKFKLFHETQQKKRKSDFNVEVYRKERRKINRHVPVKLFGKRNST